MPNTKAQEEILAWMRNNTDKLIDLAKASESRERREKRKRFHVVKGGA